MRNLKYFLAIDIGASSGRHILSHVENGKMVLEEIYRFPNGGVEKDGHLIWDVESLFSEIKNGLKKAGEMGKTPVSVGIDTWGVDYALLDKNDELLSEVFCYRDIRNDYSAEKVHEIMPFNEIYSRTGIEFAVFNTVYQLYGDKLSGKMEKAETFLQLPDYFNFLLTGVKKNEYTNGTTTALVNKDTHDWDYEIIEKLGYKRSLFKPLSQPTTVVGEIKKEI
ncbi:MAG: rhamnulokinase, partial [Clostridia bacterium]|nr:rhamnulokinase [Clostridia bacterium]